MDAMRTAIEDRIGQLEAELTRDMALYQQLSQIIPMKQGGLHELRTLLSGYDEQPAAPADMTPVEANGQVGETAHGAMG